jgi:predicted nicotinamide N-methyase
MKAGAAEVTASDIDSFAIAAMGLNAKANSVSINPLQADIVGQDQGWDTVLAGDICYERDLANRVVDWLLGLSQRGATVLIGDPGRSSLPKDRLENLAGNPDARGCGHQEIQCLALQATLNASPLQICSNFTETFANFPLQSCIIITYIYEVDSRCTRRARGRWGRNSVSSRNKE